MKDAIWIYNREDHFMKHKCRGKMTHCSRKIEEVLYFTGISDKFEGHEDNFESFLNLSLFKDYLSEDVVYITMLDLEHNVNQSACSTEL